jgi:hypothetical protein
MAHQSPAGHSKQIQYSFLAEYRPSSHILAYPEAAGKLPKAAKPQSAAIQKNRWQAEVFEAASAKNCVINTKGCIITFY